MTGSGSNLGHGPPSSQSSVSALVLPIVLWMYNIKSIVWVMSENRVLHDSRAQNSAQCPMVMCLERLSFGIISYTLVAGYYRSKIQCGQRLYVPSALCVVLSHEKPISLMRMHTLDLGFPFGLRGHAS